MRTSALLLGVFLLLGAAPSRGADEVVLTSGIRFKGQLLKETPQHIVFRSGGAEMNLPLKKIRKLTVHGKTRIITPKTALLRPSRPARKPARPAPPARSVPARTPAAKPPPPPPGPPKSSPRPARPAQNGKRITRTRAEVQALIATEGRTPPPWWNRVKLNYLPTLNLDWTTVKGWNTRKNLGAYMWSMINENPRRWKEGTRLMHHVLNVNKNNPSGQQKAMGQLGHCYHDFFGDWARAAFWWQKAGGRRITGLADCYWKLGNKPMAAAMLQQTTFDRSRYGSAIKLWSDMGELNKALLLAGATARGGNASAAYTAAGDACRQHARFPQAITFYRKVLAISGGRKGILKRNKDRARTSINLIKAYETLDLKRIPDGSYSGTNMSYVGPLSVAVTIASGRIQDVKVTKHKDKQFYSAVTATPAQIIKKQGVKGVDTFSGATITSEAIINATAKALAAAMK